MGGQGVNHTRDTSFHVALQKMVHVDSKLSLVVNPITPDGLLAGFLYFDSIAWSIGIALACFVNKFDCKFNLDIKFDRSLEIFLTSSNQCF